MGGRKCVRGKVRVDLTVMMEEDLVLQITYCIYSCTYLILELAIGAQLRARKSGTGFRGLSRTFYGNNLPQCLS